MIKCRILIHLSMSFTYSVLDDVKLNVTGLGLANIDLVLNT